MKDGREEANTLLRVDLGQRTNKEDKIDICFEHKEDVSTNPPFICALLSEIQTDILQWISDIKEKWEMYTNRCKGGVDMVGSTCKLIQLSWGMLPYSSFCGNSVAYCMRLFRPALNRSCRHASLPLSWWGWVLTPLSSGWEPSVCQSLINAHPPNIS